MIVKTFLVMFKGQEQQESMHFYYYGYKHINSNADDLVCHQKK